MDLEPFSRIKWERARDLRKRGAFGEAERELREALAEQPEHPLLKMSLAMVLVKRGKYGEAEILAQEILTTHPGDSRALSVLGEIALGKKHYEEALNHFERAAERDSSAFLQLRIAKALRGLNRLDAALHTLDNALVRNKQDPFLLREKAAVLGRLDRKGEALALYEKLRGIYPHDETIQKEMIRLRGMGRDEETNIRELRAALRISSQAENASLHELLAGKLKKQGQLEDALLHFKKASELQPENPYFLKQQGYCLKEMGRLDEAFHLLGRALMMDPGDFYVSSALEKICRMTGTEEAYLALLEEVFEAHPDRFKLLGKIKKLRKKMAREGDAQKSG